MNNVEIYKVWARLDARGFTCTHKAIGEFEEKGKTYRRTGTSLNKEKMLKVDSVYIDIHFSLIAYHTYCLYDDIQAAYDILKAHILKKYAERIPTLTAMQEHYQNAIK